MKRWPLVLIAAPAAVAVWSGWVGLGELCGFGIIHPLPGIWDTLRINTAITLPIGVEAYGAYGPGAWLTGPDGPARTSHVRVGVGLLPYHRSVLISLVTCCTLMHRVVMPGRRWGLT